MTRWPAAAEFSAHTQVMAKKMVKVVDSHGRLIRFDTLSPFVPDLISMLQHWGLISTLQNLLLLRKTARPGLLEKDTAVLQQPLVHRNRDTDGK